MDDIHPLVLKVAAKLVPVAIGGMAADVKFLVNQLRDSEECGGWQYIMTSFFDQAVGHPTYRFEEGTICFCVPDKFRVKVPNIFICDQGAYGSTIGLAAAGWLLRVLGIVPRRDRQSEDEVWLLLLTASAVLPAHLLSCLPESPCLAACFTGRQGLFNEFCEQLAAYVQEMDCVYLVIWDAWMPRIGDCMLVVVQRPGEGKDEEGVDDVEEEEDDEIVLVRGGDSKKRSTPSKKKPSSDDSGDEVDDPPKRPAKKAKDSTPLNMFHAKVGQAKGKKAPPKKK